MRNFPYFNFLRIFDSFLDKSVRGGYNIRVNVGAELMRWIFRVLKVEFRDMIFAVLLSALSFTNTVFLSKRS